MKRTISVLLALALALALTSAALAAAPKPPTTLALQDDTFILDYMLVNIKSMGTVKTSAGPIKTYNVTGWQHDQNTFPISGSGYVGVDGKFHINFSGVMVLSATGVYATGANLTLDLTTGIGTWSFIWSNSNGGGTITTGTDPMHVISSTSEPGPTAIEGLETPEPGARYQSTQ